MSSMKLLKLDTVCSMALSVCHLSSSSSSSTPLPP